MKLPNQDNAYVPPEKIKDYLLNVAHEEGGGKALFFLRFGFSVAEWELLADAIYDHAATHEVKQVISYERGTKFVIEGELAAPDGRQPIVRAVWLIETGIQFARFITAYPI